MQFIDVRLEYLKPYNCLKRNDYYQIGIITLNHMIVNKLLILDKNTWYQITEKIICAENTYIYMGKQMIIIVKWKSVILKKWL